MWKLNETSAAVEAPLHHDTENMCTLDGGEEAVYIMMWLPVPWLLLGTIDSLRENLKEAEIEFYYNQIKLYDWHLPLPFCVRDSFIANSHVQSRSAAKRNIDVLVGLLTNYLFHRIDNCEHSQCF